MAKAENQIHFLGEIGQKAFIVKDNKVLMVQGTGEKNWDFPGDMLNEGEEIEKGLLRELEEELNITEAKVGRPFFAEVYNISKPPKFLLIYRVTLTNPDQEFTLPPEELSGFR